MSGFGSFAGGLTKGYLGGLEQRRKDERQALEDARTEEDRAMKKQDHELGLQKSGLDIRTSEMGLQSSQEKAAREKLENERADKKYSFEEKHGTVLRGIFAKAQSGDIDGAMTALETTYNTDPDFDNGNGFRFVRDANGAILRGKDGKMSVESFDPATGKVIGTNSVTHEDALLAFANMNDPAKLLADKKARAEKIADESRKHAQNKELWGIKSTARATSPSRSGGGRAASDIQKAEYLREGDPSLSHSEALAIVTNGKSRSPQVVQQQLFERLSKLPAYMGAGGEDLAMQKAREWAQEIAGPTSNKPVVPAPRAEAKPAGSKPPKPNDASRNEAYLRQSLGI